MKKSLIINAFLIAGILNILWLIYFICTTEHAYVVATIPEQYFKPIIVYFPIILTTISIIVFIYDLLIFKEKNWYAFFVAFVATLPDVIFVIGSIYYGHH